MTPGRPEIGARLDHVGVEARDPAGLAAFYATAMDMSVRRVGAAWVSAGPQRTMVFLEGQSNRLRFAALSFDSRDALARYRARLVREGRALAHNPSPLFDDDAFALRDPDGALAAFGVRDAYHAPAGGPAARLQHYALRTCDPHAMLAHYRDVLHFVESDRVEDHEGRLRAAFLRSDAEHHCLALFLASEARLDHTSFDTPDIVAVRDWADRMSSLKVPIFWGVGRHGPGNDVFFMVRDAEENPVELSCELEVCTPDRATGVWDYTDRTLNLWGTPFHRS